MDWLLASALKLIASLTTVSGLAVAATLLMVLIFSGLLLGRVIAKPGKWSPVSARKNTGLAE
jgi:hypothetical protein